MMAIPAAVRPAANILVGAAMTAAALTLLAIYWRHGAQGDAGLQHWSAVHTGTVDESGPFYGFWSGFGSDLGELAIVGAIVTAMAGWYHKHNCHAEGCWRIGLHPVAGGEYMVCRRCHNKITGHPHRKLSIGHLRERHLATSGPASA